MSCFKYSVSNGCGHIHASMFRFCYKHDCDQTSMLRCHEKNHNPITNITRVRMGNGFCNRGCEAMTVGWRCCTCGFRSVDGYFHPTAMMLVHDDSFGNTHGFCDRCLTENEYITRDPTDIITSHESPTRTKSEWSTPSDAMGNTIDDKTSVSSTGTDSIFGDMDNESIDLINLLDTIVAQMGTKTDVIPPGPAETTMDAITTYETC